MRNKIGVLFEHVDKRDSSGTRENEVKRNGIFNTQTLRINETSSRDVVEAEPLCALVILCLREAHVFLFSCKLHLSGS